MKHNQRTYLSSAFLLLGLALLVGGMAPAWSQVPPDRLAGTMQNDLAHRAREIHWPDGYAPEQADLFSHNELLIHASCKTVWNRIVDAGAWPRWYPNASDVHIVGADETLGKNTVFRWTTFKLPLESKVIEFVPYSRLGWYGYAPGAGPSPQLGFYHSWLLAPTGDACRVTMDEVGRGKDAAHIRSTDESLMHRGHNLWLATLKWIAEPH
jgi:uncharacterized protein YndB with AHSA1/START domain